MAHNRTRQQQNEERKLILATKLSFYAAWHFTVFCEKCFTQRVLTIRPLLPRRPAKETVAEALAKMRCHKHHIAPSRVVLECKGLHVYLKGY